ncbi:Bacterial Ig-like domain (Group 3) [Flavobacterium anhuiense]|uniref:Bacterial Ig-like domain (Group 3) n=1 Tax=Flavobacterium anhuiense TaxID=459526 RepID=A0A444VWH8_9FLAO|nr:immunoglobulin-like domain-containing protein [Flavobacterium anhuiense]RYJ37915.1 Bacterial Ig-like domain (Group 3) [Flavobacterium anhuiense]
MKKIYISLMIVSGLLFTSCEADTDNVSKVTAYANMTMHGDALVVLTQGDTYTEAGVDAEADGKALPVKIDGTVDTSKPTVYKIKYSATNSDGFPAYLTRTIVVLSNKPSTIDLTGTFFRNGNPNVVTKLGDRKYSCDNATGYNVPADLLKMEFYNIDDKQVYAPYNPSASESGISAESNIGTITDKNNWKWVIYASAVFGTAERIFKR